MNSKREEERPALRRPLGRLLPRRCDHAHGLASDQATFFCHMPNNRPYRSSL
jgi:hypothetical protein